MFSCLHLPLLSSPTLNQNFSLMVKFTWPPKRIARPSTNTPKRARRRNPSSRSEEAPRTLSEISLKLLQSYLKYLSTIVGKSSSTQETNLAHAVLNSNHVKLYNSYNYYRILMKMSKKYSSGIFGPTHVFSYIPTYTYK
uniref:Uncharacterized protein n=1 Tax=Cacopsylla melanoneura TaxID=428564 RepID=A0A8D8M3T8_9HEMI